MLNAVVSNTLGSMASNLYDSLTISKAVFLIKGKKDKEFKQFPVMINPSTVSVDTGNRLKKSKGTGITGGASKTTQDDIGVKKSYVSDTTNSIETRVSMELMYDLVFQYDLVKSQNGTAKGLISGTVNYMGSEDDGFGESLVGGLSDSVDKYSKVHLLNGDDFSYLDMQKACSEQKDVVFVWGPMHYSGTIESFSSTFTYFSSAGAPLRAKVRLTMLCTQSSEDDFQDNNLLLNIIKSFEKKADEDGKASAEEVRNG